MGSVQDQGEGIIAEGDKRPGKEDGKVQLQLGGDVAPSRKRPRKEAAEDLIAEIPDS